MKTRTLNLVACLGLVVFLGGCGAISTIQYLHYKEQQDWPAALRVMRSEIASTGLRSGATEADFRVLGIDALGNYVRFYGFDQSLDEEASRYYQEGLRSARGDGTREAQLHRIFAVYYSKSGRNGLAVPYLRKDLEHWVKIKHTIQIILGLASLASTYADMGEIQLEDYYRAQALLIAKDYFVLGQRPSDPTEWGQYLEILNKWMDKLARPGNAVEVEKAWAVMEPIANLYLRTSYLRYVGAAQLFAVSGDTKRARGLYDKAQQMWMADRPRHPERLQLRGDADFACGLAAVQVHSGEYRLAVQELDRCARLTEATQFKVNDASFYNARGVAHEGLGEFDRAIHAYRAGIDVVERVRASYTVSERAAFFRSIGRRSYWGLIRSLARRAAANNDATDFLAALRASELIRARQLGELLDPKAEAELSDQSLEMLRQGLRPDEIVLAYTLTDRQMVLLAFTRDRQVPAIIPYDGEAFRGQILGLATDLATPDSDIAGLNRRLAEMGRLLLGPVQGLLSGKKTIIVLPDGVVNAIPFDLLSVDAGGYRPLFRDYVVSVAPSLRFIEYAGKRKRQRQGEGLFAVADPVYAKGPRIAGLSETEVRAATRGSHYLRYFSRLPETRTEVQAIARLFGAERVETVLGDKATESSLKRADLRPFRYIHLATHGILGGEVPGIGEPALVLADEPGEDGFLTASEVAQLKLDADLTVLSACKTGTGEYYTGEGVMGLSRAFLVAGSRSVLVSLWEVESKATERLMVAFYRYLRAGVDAPEALRRAKLDMIAEAQRTDPKQAHPFFWAPFILFGG